MYSKEEAYKGPHQHRLECFYKDTIFILLGSVWSCSVLSTQIIELSASSALWDQKEVMEKQPVLRAHHTPHLSTTSPQITFPL